MLHRSELPLLALAIAALLALAPAPSDSAGMSAVDVLRAMGLPIGLLPKGVREFNLDQDGRFEAHLDYPCLAKFENCVRYETNVSGILSYGRISSLSGVSAQDLFLWLPVKTILVDNPLSGVIYFDVGAVRKQFSRSLFDTPPECSPSDEDNVVALHHGDRGGDLDPDLEDAQRNVL
ncbi:hypothetical protein J5N97_007330 [Dioscorea zingiberensis]|uniref:Uncharacterized protein n=1 Tax=Dioscorea zingiberensis TaxID=325984 RepID=A0A9D5DCZ6_9LILI|nr:hypothetical protein J5N97_007330 [Dioscorea zingiberensis]